MASQTKCPACGTWYDSNTTHECSSVVGGAGDLTQHKKGKFQETEGGTGSN